MPISKSPKAAESDSIKNGGLPGAVGSAKGDQLARILPFRTEFVAYLNEYHRPGDKVPVTWLDSWLSENFGVGYSSATDKFWSVLRKEVQAGLHPGLSLAWDFWGDGGGEYLLRVAVDAGSGSGSGPKPGIFRWPFRRLKPEPDAVPCVSERVIRKVEDADDEWLEWVSGKLAMYIDCPFEGDEFGYNNLDKFIHDENVGGGCGSMLWLQGSVALLIWDRFDLDVQGGRFPGLSMVAPLRVRIDREGETKVVDDAAPPAPLPTALEYLAVMKSSEVGTCFNRHDFRTWMNNSYGVPSISWLEKAWEELLIKADQVDGLCRAESTIGRVADVAKGPESPLAVCYKQVVRMSDIGSKFTCWDFMKWVKAEHPGAYGFLMESTKKGPLKDIWHEELLPMARREPWMKTLHGYGIERVEAKPKVCVAVDPAAEKSSDYSSVSEVSIGGSSMDVIRTWDFVGESEGPYRDTIPAGDGWRHLEPEEQVKKGDEYVLLKEWNAHGKLVWSKQVLSFTGCKVEDLRKFGLIYRRREVGGVDDAAKNTPEPTAGCWMSQLRNQVSELKDVTEDWLHSMSAVLAGYGKKPNHETDRFSALDAMNLLRAANWDLPAAVRGKVFERFKEDVADGRFPWFEPDRTGTSGIVRRLVVSPLPELKPKTRLRSLPARWEAKEAADKIISSRVIRVHEDADSEWLDWCSEQFSYWRKAGGGGKDLSCTNLEEWVSENVNFECSVSESFKAGLSLKLWNHLPWSVRTTSTREQRRQSMGPQREPEKTALSMWKKLLRFCNGNKIMALDTFARYWAEEYADLITSSILLGDSCREELISIDQLRNWLEKNEVYCDVSEDEGVIEPGSVFQSEDFHVSVWEELCHQIGAGRHERLSVISDKQLSLAPKSPSEEADAVEPDEGMEPNEAHALEWMRVKSRQSEVAFADSPVEDGDIEMASVEGTCSGCGVSIKGKAAATPPFDPDKYEAVLVCSGCAALEFNPTFEGEMQWAKTIDPSSEEGADALKKIAAKVEEAFDAHIVDGYLVEFGVDLTVTMDREHFELWFEKQGWDQTDSRLIWRRVLKHVAGGGRRGLVVGTNKFGVHEIRHCWETFAELFGGECELHELNSAGDLFVALDRRLGIAVFGATAYDAMDAMSDAWRSHEIADDAKAAKTEKEESETDPLSKGAADFAEYLREGRRRDRAARLRDHIKQRVPSPIPEDSVSIAELKPTWAELGEMLGEFKSMNRRVEALRKKLGWIIPTSIPKIVDSFIRRECVHCPMEIGSCTEHYEKDGKYYHVACYRKMLAGEPPEPKEEVNF